jgi:hypothetical protein
MDISQALEGFVYPIYLRYVGIRNLIQFGSLLKKRFILVTLMVWGRFCNLGKLC